jgi:C4-dicarboxylate transporter, DctQ subunit
LPSPAFSRRLFSLKLAKGFLNALNKMAQVLLLACSLIAFFGVFLRYIFRAPLYWGEEATVILLVWFVFLPQGLLEAKNEQLCMTALYQAVPEKVRRMLDLLRCAVTFLFPLYLAFVAKDVVVRNYSNNSRTAALEIPFWVLYLIICVALVCIAIGRSIAFYEAMVSRRQV